MERKIFKLSTGEAVPAADLEGQIGKVCHYVKFAVVEGEGKEYPVALIFPEKKFLENPDYELSPEEGCFCPRNLSELGRCISGCLQLVNKNIEASNLKIAQATIIDKELRNAENREDIIKKYRSHLLNMYGENVPVTEEVYLIKFE